MTETDIDQLWDDYIKPGPGLRIHKRNAKLKALEKFYKHGVIQALYDALLMCRSSNKTTPDWVMEGAIDIVATRLKNPQVIGKAGKGNETARYQRNQRHLMRWQVVTRELEKGTPFKDVFGIAADRLHQLSSSAVQRGLGHEEQMFLKQLAMQDQAIRSSYFKVLKAKKNPEEVFQYYRGSIDADELTHTPALGKRLKFGPKILG